MLRLRPRRPRSATELGQTLPLICFFMVTLLGVSGMVLDLGNAYVQRRAVQNEADAAAIAGADAIPNGGYTAAAQQMAAKNSRPGDNVTVTFNGTDTVTVTVSRTAPTFLLKVFGKSSIPVSATAVARIEALAAVKGHVSPYAVTVDAYATGGGSGLTINGQWVSLQLPPTGQTTQYVPGAIGQVLTSELIG